MNYNQLVKIVYDKGCNLDWSEEDFKEKYKNTKTKIDIISSCGHKKIVQYSNFVHKNTGILCNQCGYDKMSKDTKGIDCDLNLMEYQTIKSFEDLCKLQFNFKILVEGTLADIAIKPINESNDSWLPIQIKTTKSLSHGIYSFHTGNKYTNMYVLLYCINDERIWILNGNDIDIKTINIGKYKSIYSKYEVKSNKFSDHLLDLYNKDDNKFKKPLSELNIPISLNSQQEQEFKMFRENLFKDLHFEYPEINNRVYDSIINYVYKVQDKVITSYRKKSDNKEKYRDTISYCVRLCRVNKDGNLMYKIGDNDFYWLSLPDKKGAYIIPENILLEKNMISNKDECKTVSALRLYPYHSEEKLEKIKTSWVNDYLYFYDKDIEKINALFIPGDRIPIILYDNNITKIKINTTKKYIAKLKI
jgi:hypothetical protein